MKMESGDEKKKEAGKGDVRGDKPSEPYAEPEKPQDINLEDSNPSESGSDDVWEEDTPPQLPPGPSADLVDEAEIFDITDDGPTPSNEAEIFDISDSEPTPPSEEDIFDISDAEPTSSNEADIFDFADDEPTPPDEANEDTPGPPPGAPDEE